MPERTPEQIGREAGQAIADSIADGLETVILELTDAIASLRVEQAELRDELLTLTNDHNALGNAFSSHLLRTHGG
jgi:hypothetical protein